MNHLRSLVWSLVSTTNQWTWDRLFSGNISVKHCLSTWKRDHHAKNTRLQHYVMSYHSQFCNRIYILNLRPKQVKWLKGSSNGKASVAFLPKGYKKSMIFPLLPVWMQRKFNSGESPSISPYRLSFNDHFHPGSNPKDCWGNLGNCGFERQAKGEYRSFEA